jgi:hypothetical protein
MIFDPDMDLYSCINRILDSSDKEMIEQTLWLVGNIIGESSKFLRMITENTNLISAMERYVANETLVKSLNF